MVLQIAHSSENWTQKEHYEVKEISNNSPNFLLVINWAYIWQIHIFYHKNNNECQNSIKSKDTQTQNTTLSSNSTLSLGHILLFVTGYKTFNHPLQSFSMFGV